MIELPVAGIRSAVIHLTTNERSEVATSRSATPLSGTRTTSNINWSTSGPTVANLAITMLHETSLSIFAGGGGSTNFIVDVMVLVG